jgi:isoquinoline 1-oxidoreductase beta subunit
MKCRASKAREKRCRHKEIDVKESIGGQRSALFKTRRRLILGGSLIGGALVVGYAARNLDAVASNAFSVGAPEIDTGVFGPFIRIDGDGWVTVINKHQEMGQGTHAGVAAIVAEELDANWDKVKVEAAPANASLYRNLDLSGGLQGTGSSSGIANSWNQLRTAGAAARAMLVHAAASRWSVESSSIDVENGVVRHRESGRHFEFADLLADAARMGRPPRFTLKDPKAFRLIGTDRVRRKDMVGKTSGTAVYTQDVHLPNMLTAMVAHSPLFGGKVASFDATAARKIAGVMDVFEIPSGIAVVATNTYAARRGRDALKVIWDDVNAEKRSSEQLVDYYHRLADGEGDVCASAFQTVGDASKAFASEPFEAAFDFPFLAQAAMEPMNCVAQVNGRSVKLTFASQLQTLDQINTALAAVTLPGMVEIVTLPAGGSFGRRGVLNSDYVVECVHIARRVGADRPVKLVWAREDDMRSGAYRPMVHHRLWIECDADGFPSAWRHHTVAQTLVPVGPNKLAVEGIKDSPYLSAAKIVDGKVYSPSLQVPVGFWRSVGHSHTAMVMEHTIDQLARRANRDPADYRRAIYLKTGAARWLATLDLACARAGWGSPLESGWARGLAVHECYGTVVAQIAEVKLIDGGVQVRRVVCAVDCGMVVSPDQVAAQMEGGVCFGLSAALFGKITLVEGRVQQTNFDTYRVLRLDEAPSVETYIVPSMNDPTGVGEPGTPLIAPAVANAVLALTGKATGALPFLT